MNLDQLLDANGRRRLAAEDRYLRRLERLEAQAEPLIGTLIRDGRVVYYINTRNGKTREDSHPSLVHFLIRNKYI